MSVCPCCGYCPNCGHRYNQPYQPYYPYQWQYQPSYIGNSGTFTNAQPYVGSGYASSGTVTWPSAETTTFGQGSYSGLGSIQDQTAVDSLQGACCASNPAGVQ